MDLQHWRFLIQHRDAWSWLTWYTRFINHKLKKKISFRITNQPSRGGTFNSGEINPLLHHHVSIMGLHLVRYLSLPFAPSFYHGLAPTPESHIILFVPWHGVAYSFPDPSNARRYRGSCALTELLAHNTNFYGHNLIFFAIIYVSILLLMHMSHRADDTPNLLLIKSPYSELML